MTKADAGKVYEGLPKWAKGVIVVGLVGAALWGGYRIYKAINAAKDKEHSEDEKNKKDDELKKLLNSGHVTSAPDSQFQTWANDLEKALSGCWVDVDTLMMVITKLKNGNVDWLALNKAFGVREIKGCMLAANQKVTLSEALNWKLIGSEGESVNKILEKQGITYKL